MTTGIPADDAFVPDPEDWPAAAAVDVPAERAQHEPDDVVTVLPDDDSIPLEASEADVVDQRREVDLDEDDLG